MSTRGAGARNGVRRYAWPAARARCRHRGRFGECTRLRRARGHEVSVGHRRRRHLHPGARPQRDTDDVVRRCFGHRGAHDVRAVPQARRRQGRRAQVLGSCCVSNPPEWLQPLLTAAAAVPAEELSRFLPPEQGGRESAVLILFGDGPDGPDLLFIERSSQLRNHAGQPAFPGGGTDPEDDGPVTTAVREAVEETGLDPAGVDVLMTLPALWLPPSGYVVTPVIAWWRVPSAVRTADTEVAAVVRVPI